jgi:hypothetical protein
MRFSIETFKQRVGPLDLDGIDFDSFRDQPLDEATLRCLRYMHDVEHHTVCYLRDVLVTDAHRDPEITAFLTFWVFEEFWHGEALGKVLEAHREPGSAARVQATRQRVGRHDRMMPIYTMVANRLTRHVPAVHMAWGAINEWTTQAAYRRVAAKADHPVLADLLGRISKQEGRHIDFYATQATRRLESSATAQRLCRFALTHLWSPVGASVMPESEVLHMARHVFGDAEGAKAAARVDHQVGRLPGLADLHLLRDSVAAAA